MKVKFTKLMWIRALIDTADFCFFNILLPASIVMSIDGLIQNKQIGVFWFVIALLSLLIHAICNALLYYKRALYGKLFFGGKIADALFIIRQNRRQVRAEKMTGAR